MDAKYFRIEIEVDGHPSYAEVEEAMMMAGFTQVDITRKANSRSTSLQLRGRIPDGKAESWNAVTILSAYVDVCRQLG